MRVLGISAFYHDSAAALIEDGEIVARRAGGALHPQEARCAAFPGTRSHTASTTAGIKLTDVDYVAFYDKPFLKFERLLETYLAFAPRGFQLLPHGHAAVAAGEAVPEDTAARRDAASSQPDFDWQKRLLFGEHHQSHAASAFFPSPFEEAAVLTHGRRRRMGDHVAGARARATSSRC